VGKRGNNFGSSESRNSGAAAAASIQLLYCNVFGPNINLWASSEFVGQALTQTR